MNRPRRIAESHAFQMLDRYGLDEAIDRLERRMVAFASETNAPEPRLRWTITTWAWRSLKDFRAGKTAKPEVRRGLLRMV